MPTAGDHEQRVLAPKLHLVKSSSFAGVWGGSGYGLLLGCQDLGLAFFSWVVQGLLDKFISRE